ncbi:MAG: hypothetical protein MK102_12595 [Fuerstiella sp.]|nr:hypothetical protein [Fuerstiella sp.]
MTDDAAWKTLVFDPSIPKEKTQLAENRAAARSVLGLLARRLASADSTFNFPDMS